MRHSIQMVFAATLALFERRATLRHGRVSSRRSTLASK
jgi:hypothetical protein